MRLKLLLLICCLPAYITALSQVPYKAQKHFMHAMQLHKAWRTDGACKEMQQAIKEYPAYAEAYSTLGEWYFGLHQFGAAADIFRKAMASCKDGAKSFAKPYAKCLIFDNKPDSALMVLDGYQPAKATDEYEALKKQAAFVRNALDHPWDDVAYNMGPRINTISPEMFPSIAADTQTFYFTRRHNNMDEDFYYALPDSCGGWLTAQNMGAPLNTSDLESSQMISADGHYMFFTRCNNRSEDGWAAGGCDLFMAYRVATDSPWTVPQSFGGTINSPAYEGMPCLSADNRDLYFTSDREGGHGGFDIWVSHFEDGRWHRPVNLGPQINTPGNETAPFIHIDNNTLYFASDGLPGMGGKDLFMSHRINDSTWTPPVNLGYPINSTADECSESVTTDGQHIYFSSDRDSIAGNFDLYEMKLPQELHPEVVSTIKGIAYDSLVKDPLNYTSIYINNAATGAQLYHFMSNRGDGSFMITLPIGADYAIQANRIGYMETDDTLRLAHDTVATTIQRNIPLLPEGYVKPINDSLILTLHFPLNSATLTDSDATAIQDVMQPWLTEPGIVILINGYTDNTGTPIINEQLSYARAGLVKAAMLKLGIDEVMIKAQGWGEANPVADNDTEDGRNRNRRVEIIIRR